MDEAMELEEPSTRILKSSRDESAKEDDKPGTQVFRG